MAYRANATDQDQSLAESVVHIVVSYVSCRTLCKISSLEFLGNSESVREETPPFPCFSGFLIRRSYWVAKFVLIDSGLAGGELYAGAIHLTKG